MKQTIVEGGVFESNPIEVSHAEKSVVKATIFES